MSSARRYELGRQRFGRNGVRAALFVSDESHIGLVESDEGAWSLYVASEHGGDVAIYLRDVDTMRRLHDTLGAALADLDGDEQAETLTGGES